MISCSYNMATDDSNNPESNGVHPITTQMNGSPDPRTPVNRSVSEPVPASKPLDQLQSPLSARLPTDQQDPLKPQVGPQVGPQGRRLLQNMASAGIIKRSKMSVAEMVAMRMPRHSQTAMRLRRGISFDKVSTTPLILI